MKVDQARAGRSLPLNLHLQQLAYLRELRRQGSITAAARALNISQPALSQALAEVERRLGCRLFERRGRHRHPTAEGQEVLAFAERVLREADELEGKLAARRSGEGGRLRVGMIDAASIYVLPAAVREFRAAHPRVDLRLTVASSTELLAALRNLQLDLVFAIGPVDQDVRGEEVKVEPLYVYAPTGEKRRPEDAEWVLYPIGSRTRALIDAGMESVGMEPSVTLESGSPEVLRQMVALGFGWSVLPEDVVRDEPGIVAVQSQPIAYRSLMAMQRRVAPEDPLVELFLDHARQV